MNTNLTASQSYAVKLIDLLDKLDNIGYNDVSADELSELAQLISLRPKTLRTALKSYLDRSMRQRANSQTYAARTVAYTKREQRRAQAN